MHRILNLRDLGFNTVVSNRPNSNSGMNHEALTPKNEGTQRSHKLEALGVFLFIWKGISEFQPTNLQQQGISWVMRTALYFARVTVRIHEYPNEENPEIYHVKAESVVTGVIPGTTEFRTLDWKKREHTDSIFGDLIGQSRHFTDINALDIQSYVENIEDRKKIADFLTGKTLPDGSESEGFTGEEFMQSFVKAELGWTAEQVWGFEIIDGKRFHTRRVVVVRGNKIEMTRLVYSFIARRAEQFVMSAAGKHLGS